MAPALTTSIELNGYAPEAENDPAGQALAARRVQAVVDLLRAQGVPAERIIERSHGREFVFVPGAPRDPQNILVYARFRR